MPFDLIKQLHCKVVPFQKMPELADRGFIRYLTQAQTSKLAYTWHIIQTVFYPWIA